MPVNVAYMYRFHTVGSLTWRKILRDGADRFTSPPKVVVPRIFIALKNSPSSAGLKPHTLDPMAFTITLDRRG
jgi:hypothetical protein